MGKSQPHARPAAALVKEVGCSQALARAALTSCSGDLKNAKELLTNGHSSVYENGLGAFGRHHGDKVFQHPYVQCLLEAARERIKAVLSENKEDNWLICVRTYGRARPPDAFASLQQFVKKAGANPDVAEKLQAAGIDDLSKLKAALVDEDNFTERIVSGGSRKLTGSTIEKLVRGVATPFQHHLKASEKGVLDLTLAALTRALGADAYRRCLIFVSHEDKDFISGKYDAALNDTPWKDRIVCGVKGAHLQVRFIEEAAPPGAHIVIADDNIEDFVVENARMNKDGKTLVAEEEVQKRNYSFMRRCLDIEEPQDPLIGTSLEIVEESEIHQFLRGARPKDKLPAVKMMEERLHAVKINTVEQLKDSLKEGKSEDVKINDLLKAAGHDRINVPMLKSLRSQAALDKLPPLMRLAVKKSNEKGKGRKTWSKKPELAQLISRAGSEMTSHEANLWGISSTQNHYFLKSYGDGVRKKAETKGIFVDYSKNLALIYGAFFGFRVLKDPARYTRFGQIKDDVERTLRYWHQDKAILLFKRYGVTKTHKPGKFFANKGGISAGSSAEHHASEASKALNGIIEDFASPYVRLPFPEETKTVTCGLVWRQAEEKEEHEEENTVKIQKRPAPQEKEEPEKEKAVKIQKRSAPQEKKDTWTNKSDNRRGWHNRMVGQQHHKGSEKHQRKGIAGVSKMAKMVGRPAKKTKEDKVELVKSQRREAKASDASNVPSDDIETLLPKDAPDNHDAHAKCQQVIQDSKGEPIIKFCYTTQEGCKGLFQIATKRFPSVDVAKRVARHIYAGLHDGALTPEEAKAFRQEIYRKMKTFVGDDAMVSNTGKSCAILANGGRDVD